MSVVTGQWPIREELGGIYGEYGQQRVPFKDQGGAAMGSSEINRRKIELHGLRPSWLISMGEASLNRQQRSYLCGRSKLQLLLRTVA